MGVDFTRSAFYEAFGDDAAARAAKLERLDVLADKLDLGTTTPADEREALHIVVDLVLGRRAD